MSKKKAVFGILLLTSLGSLDLQADSRTWSESQVQQAALEVCESLYPVYHQTLDQVEAKVVQYAGRHSGAISNSLKHELEGARSDLKKAENCVLNLRGKLEAVKKEAAVAAVTANPIKPGSESRTSPNAGARGGSSSFSAQ